MIHVIGNSHVNTFSMAHSLTRDKSNSELFKLKCLGPVTARYLYDVHLNKIDKYLAHVDKENDYIILMAGEVDCRFHIPLQADRKNKKKKKTPDTEMVDIFMEGFMKTYDYLLGLGYKLVSFGTHPSTTEDTSMTNLRRPIYDKPERRNNISVMWNTALERESKKRNIPYFSIYHYLVNSKNQTNMDYYLDYCHLNGYQVFGFIITEIKKLRLK